jgi:hypothetical protein
MYQYKYANQDIVIKNTMLFYEFHETFELYYIVLF